MKKIFYTVFVTASVLIFLHQIALATADAHVLKTDGQIGAVLHISPDDDPTAGLESGFFFEFRDKSNRFKPQNCDCRGTILQNGAELFSENLFEQNSNAALQGIRYSYTFPARGIYTVQVMGTPKDGSFQPFTLSWDVRVEKTSGEKPKSTFLGLDASFFTTHIWHFVVGIGILILSAVALIMKQKEKGKGRRGE